MKTRGYSMLEVLIALGILVAGLMSLLAMVPGSVRRTRSAHEGAVASAALGAAFEETRRMAFGGEAEEGLDEYATVSAAPREGKAAPGEYGGRLGEIVWRANVSGEGPLHEVELELTSADGRLILRAKSLLSDRSGK